MTQSITLELTDELIERAKKQAKQTDQPMERVLVQWLELASNEAEQFFTSGAQYEVWSPYDSAEAAETLWKLLEDDAVDVADQLRQALNDVKAGRVYPYDKLREMIDDNRFPHL